MVNSTPTNEFIKTHSDRQSSNNFTNDKLIDNLINIEEIQIVSEYDLNGLQIILYVTKIDGTHKYCIKKEGDKLFETDFIFDSISNLLEINGKIYYFAQIGDKYGYIEFGQEGEYKDKIIFDTIVNLIEINGNYYYKANIGNKRGWIQLGKEAEYKDSMIFYGVGDIQVINGKFYYKAKIGLYIGYIELGKEAEYKEKIIFDEVEYLQRINGKVYYRAGIGNKYGYIELGKEGEYKEILIFDEALRKKQINGKILYRVRKGDKVGYIELGKEREYKEKIIFDEAWDLWDFQEINGKIYYKARIGNKWGYIELGKEAEYKEKIIFNEVGPLKNTEGIIGYRVLYGKKNRYAQVGKECIFKKTIFRKLTVFNKNNKLHTKTLTIQSGKKRQILGNTDGFMQQLEKIYEEIPQHYDVDLNYNDQYLIEGKLILQKPSTLSENVWKQFLENFDTELEIVISGCNYYQLKSIIDEYEIKVQNTIKNIKI